MFLKTCESICAGVFLLMAPKTFFDRLFDITSLVASNAFTACAAAVIAFDNSETPPSEVFFSADKLALYALVSFFIYLGLGISIWAGRAYQVRKLMIEAGYDKYPKFNEAPTETIDDPILRIKVRQAKIKYYSDMESVCLVTSLMAAGMIAAMYLSNTGITIYGWAANNTALFAYLAPILLLTAFFGLGIFCFLKCRALNDVTQKWIAVEHRKPKPKDFGPGFIQNTVLFRAPQRLDKWGKSFYKVIELSHLEKHLPPKEKRKGIAWTFIPE